MKKLLFMLLGFAAAINAMAVDFTAKATLLLESNTSHLTCEMTLVQSDDYGVLDGYDMYMPGRKVALYPICGERQLQVAMAADFTNVQLGLKTDAATEYTITVSGVEGAQTLVLYDLADMSDIKQYPLTEGTINITAAANSTIEDRFVINYVAPAPVYAAEVTTNEYGLATFSHASDLAPVEAGVKLYKGAVSGETLALTQVADIAGGQGVIVYGEANTTYHFNVINGATADFAGNQLLAATAWSASHDGYDIYVLSGNALYLYEGTDFPANKAFLKIAQSANPSPRRIRLVFDQATAIDNISADNVKAEKVVENGQILIRRGNEVYNLQGQIVK